MGYPLYRAVFLSLHRWMGPGQTPLFIGIRNFQEILTDPLFSQAFINTFYLTFVALLLTNGVAFFIALLLAKVTKLRGLLRALYFIPTIVGIVAVGIIWQWMYEPIFGFFNYALRILGFPPQYWTRDPKLALFCVAVVHAWIRFGFTTIVYLSGLLSIPILFYDAAKVDGANKLQETIHITIPLLIPTAGLLLVLNSIMALQVFGEVFMLTEGGPSNASNTVAFLMYKTAFLFARMGKGSAMALVLFGVILLITIFQMRVLEKRKIEY